MINGAVLKKKRREVCLTQKQLGMMTGYTESYIQKVERGHRVPSLYALMMIAGELGIDVKEVFKKDASTDD